MGASTHSKAEPSPLRGTSFRLQRGPSLKSSLGQPPSATRAPLPEVALRALRRASSRHLGQATLGRTISAAAFADASRGDFSQLEPVLEAQAPPNASIAPGNASQGAPGADALEQADSEDRPPASVTFQPDPGASLRARLKQQAIESSYGDARSAGDDGQARRIPRLGERGGTAAEPETRPEWQDGAEAGADGLSTAEESAAVGGAPRSAIKGFGGAPEEDDLIGFGTDADVELEGVPLDETAVRVRRRKRLETMLSAGVVQRPVVVLRRAVWAAVAVILGVHALGFGLLISSVMELSSLLDMVDLAGGTAVRPLRLLRCVCAALRMASACGGLLVSILAL